MTTLFYAQFTDASSPVYWSQSDCDRYHSNSS